METRANYILIGLFTLLSLVAMFGFFIWLASVQLDRQYATYGILFDDVTGLSPSGDVRYNGISVGKVVGLEIDGIDPSKILATIEIDAAVPIRISTMAQLQAQGVTGVASISLTSGPSEAAPLIATDRALPIIASRRSTVQSLVDDAPDLMADIITLLDQFSQIASQENQEHLSNLLRNLDTASESLDTALADFSDVAGILAEATSGVSGLTDEIAGLPEVIETTLDQANATLQTADKALNDIGAAAIRFDELSAQGQEVLRQANDAVFEPLPELLAQATVTLDGFDTAITDLRAPTRAAAESFAITASSLTDWLAALDVSTDQADAAFRAVQEAAEGFETIVARDGDRLINDVRGLIATLSTIARRIDQDPGRFLFDNRVPEYRR